MVPEISIHCSRYIFGEEKASIKRIRVKNISDSFILLYELHYKLGIELKQVLQKKTQLIPHPKTTTKYSKLLLSNQQALAGMPPVTGSPQLHQVAHSNGLFRRVP